MDTDGTLQTSLNNDHLCLSFSGSWTIHAPCCSIPDIHRLFSPQIKGVCFNTDKLTEWDSRLLIELSQILDLAASLSLTVDDQGLPPGVRKLLQLTRKKNDPRQGSESHYWFRDPDRYR